MAEYFYKPTFLHPNNIGISPYADCIFTWQNNMSMPQAYFQLYIYNNSNNVLVYDSTKIMSGSASFTLPAHTLLSNVYYKWKVHVYKDDTNYLESNYVLFKTNISPTVSISAIPSPLTSQSYTFNAAYTHSEGVPLKSFKFIFYDGQDNVVHDSGFIYGDTIIYTIYGLMNNTDYKVKCVVICQNDMEVESDTIGSFSVSYNMPYSIEDLIITPLNDIGAIKLNWENINQVVGIVNGDYSFTVDGKFLKAINLNQYTELLYNKKIPTENTLTFWVKLGSNFKGIFLNMGDEFLVGYDGERFYYKNKYRLTAGVATVLPTDWFFVGVIPNAVLINIGGNIQIIN